MSNEKDKKAIPLDASITLIGGAPYSRRPVRKPPVEYRCATCGKITRQTWMETHLYDGPRPEAPSHVCDCPQQPSVASLPEPQPSETIVHKIVRDPSVSPEDGAGARQRRTPKPGIPHFSIEYHPVTKRPIFRFLNYEALIAAVRYAQTHEHCRLGNGYLTFDP